MKNTKKRKRIFSAVLIAGIIFGIYSLCIKQIAKTEDSEAYETHINRVYDNGEDTVLLTLKDINTVSTNGVEITIPAYTQIKTYVFENTLIEENIYSFKFRGLDVEYEVEYKDDTSNPTVLLFKNELIYVLNEEQLLYSKPDINSDKITTVAKDTTIINEFQLTNGWVYCVTGDKKTGWMKLSRTKETAEYPTYKEAEYLITKTDVKPSLFFDNIILFLNQFPNIQGITITTFSNELKENN